MSKLKLGLYDLNNSYNANAIKGTAVYKGDTVNVFDTKVNDNGVVHLVGIGDWQRYIYDSELESFVWFN